MGLDATVTHDSWGKLPLSFDVPVVGTGVDPVTSRFSGRIFTVGGPRA
jgi:hypothetical protein